MIPVNIALDLSNNFSDLNKNIDSNKIIFDDNHIPHITLLQFFTNVNNIKIIQNIIKNIDFKLNINDYELKISKYNKNEYIYTINIKSDSLKNFHLILFNKFKKYIESPKILNNFGEEIKNNLIPETILNYYINSSQNNFNPHISLIYGNFKKDNKINAIKNLPSIKTKKFRIKNLAIVDVNEKINQWNILEKVNLSI